MRFTPPNPLLVGRLVFELDDTMGLSKTTANFLALCTGEKGMCKNAPNKKLHYLGCPVHRIVKGFVAQGGDVTRGDGSGGEVCLTVMHAGAAWGLCRCGLTRMWAFIVSFHTWHHNAACIVTHAVATHAHTCFNVDVCVCDSVRIYNDIAS